MGFKDKEIKTYLVVDERTTHGFARITIRTTINGGIINNHLYLAGAEWIVDMQNLFEMKGLMLSVNSQGPILYIVGLWNVKCTKCSRTSWAADDMPCECGGMMKVKGRVKGE